MYYLLITVILLMYINLRFQPIGRFRDKMETQYAYIICVFLVLLAAFRGDAVGADTESYREHYEFMYMYNSLPALIDRYSIYYMGYYIPCKLFHLLHLPVQVWFGFVMALYLYSMMRLINKFSKDKIFSILIFITNGLWAFSMAGLKQTFAMSLMMLAFVFFLEKRYLWTTLFVIAIYYTHQSALIGLAAFPLYYFRKSKWFMPIILLTCFFIYSSSFLLMESMVEILGNEKWVDYLVTDSQYTYVTFIFYSVITGVAFINIRNYISIDPEYAKYFLGLSILGCGIQLFAGVSPSLFRLAYLYTPFMMILLPNSIVYSHSSYKSISKIFLVASVIFYFLYANRNWPYEFC